MTEIQRILDHLRDARRYSLDYPKWSEQSAKTAIEILVSVNLDDDQDIDPDFCLRLIRNLTVGAHFLAVDPEVLRGYVTGAILELQGWEARNK